MFFVDLSSCFYLLKLLDSEVLVLLFLILKLRYMFLKIYF